MTKSPLLSILTVNKNDNYHKHQLHRTKFILNYLVHSLKKMNAFNKVEYVLVDWGSKEPLSNYFYNIAQNETDLTILDALFNIGPETPDYIRSL